MKIKGLIEIMKRFPDQNEEIIVAWWEKSTVEEWLERKISHKQWEYAEDDVMCGDWGDVDAQIVYSIENYEEEDKDENI
jgi:hypothetical protein